MLFNQVVGQERQKDQLRHFVNANRIPHALIMLGQHGTGGLPLTLAFSRYVLCENRSENDSCGQCQPCIFFNKLQHPDVHFTYPTVGAKVISSDFRKEWNEHVLSTPYIDAHQWIEFIAKEDKAGNINVHECQDIMRRLSLVSFNGGYKIQIIWMAEYLHNEGNRLLKLLEEPAPKTVLILVAEREEQVLNTILSRCQTLRLSPLSDTELVEGLQKYAHITEDEAEAIAPLVEGDLTEALQLVDDKANSFSNQFVEWMRLCYVADKKGADLVHSSEALAGIGKEKLKMLLRYSLHFCREMLLLKAEIRNSPRLRNTEKETAVKMANLLTFVQIEQISNLFNDYIYRIERNANTKTLMLTLSLKLHQVMRFEVEVPVLKPYLL